jgi:16S rRNA C967 or C1407 C5-methylase (RsmB/RsmF family)
MGKDNLKGVNKIIAPLFLDPSNFLEALFSGKGARPSLLFTNKGKKLLHEIEISLPSFLKEKLEAHGVFATTVLKDDRWGAHPYHQEGLYYALDLSSLILISGVLALNKSPESIIDLCASPGGKSVFLAESFPKVPLITNEVERKRLPVLIGNLRRCGVGSEIINRTLEDIVKEYGNAFDLVVCDAPCSGQSLIARSKKLEKGWQGAFNAILINGNVKRQRRILHQCASLVTRNGYLAYLTCTYSLEENEKMMEWFLLQYPNFVSVEVPHLSDLKSTYSEINCYRIFPQSGFGCGGFLSILIKSDR